LKYARELRPWSIYGTNCLKFVDSGKLYCLDFLSNYERNMNPTQAFWMYLCRGNAILALVCAPLLSWAHPGHVATPHHWEIPSKDPDRIILTWADDPATTQAVTWRTSDEIERGFVEIAPGDPSARFDAAAQRFEARTEALQIGASELNASRTDHYHSYVFRGLTPGALYAYRVGDGKNYWSEWIQFRTVEDEAAPLRFLYFGDAQNSVLSHWSRIIRAAYQKAPDADFAIHAGDLINRAHRDHEWAEWFKAGGWIHASLSSIPVPGNHEYGRFEEESEEARRLSLQWGPQFTLPESKGLPDKLKETVYALRIQDVLVVALDSNTEVEAQAAWLDKTLAADDSSWKVLTFHHPIFSSGRDRDNEKNRNLWKPIIDKHSVDLVLQGHDHTYARGHVPVRMSDSRSSNVETMYVNSVSGPKMYEFRENGWDVFESYGARLDRRAENTQFFQVIDIDGRKLVYRAYMANGELYDEFEMTKRKNGSKRIRNGAIADSPERNMNSGIPYERGNL